MLVFHHVKRVWKQNLNSIRVTNQKEINKETAAVWLLQHTVLSEDINC